MGADGNLRRPQAPAAAVLILPHIRRFVKQNAENFSARNPARSRVAACPIFSGKKPCILSEVFLTIAALYTKIILNCVLWKLRRPVCSAG